MHVTLFGLILLPLCLLWFPRPERLLVLILVTGVFGAATPMVIGSLGLPPTAPPAAMFVLYVISQIGFGVQFEGARTVMRTLEPYLLAITYGLISALVMPRLFAHQLQVWPQKEGVIYGTVPLMPGPGNVTQSFYLMMTCSVLVAAALYLARREIDLVRLVRAYLWCGGLAIFFAGWQLVHKLSGLWFPYAFISNNPGFVLTNSETFGFVPRINGSFVEPSDLAHYLSGLVFASGWLVLRGFPSRLPRWTLVGGAFAMLISTSTTGIAMLVLGAGGCALIALLRQRTAVARRVVGVGVPLLAALVVAGGVVVTLKPSVGRSLDVVYSSTLAKQKSASFSDRTQKDLDALATVFPTLGFGTGWGSFRSSSLVPGLLAGLGVWGTALVAWFVLRVVKLLRRARRAGEAAAVNAHDLWAIEATRAACSGALLGALISAPEIVNLDFYVLLATLIAASVRVAVLGRTTVAVPAPIVSA
ncbi:MAG: hypothetical protein KGK10_12210 [Rhodospirillales bacterium]|nr:hypothetical protein [Rhodospirillales bacterium]